MRGDVERGVCAACNIGNSEDAASVENVVSQARVVLSTAGPFIKYTMPVVDACVKLGRTL